MRLESDEHIIDAVICTYNEQIEKINLTLKGCLAQKKPFRNIYIVDDGSEFFFDSSSLINHPAIQVIQLKENMGISAARNAAIKLSNAKFIACINVEVFLEIDWLKNLHDFLIAEPKAGCVFGKLVPFKKSLLSAWRMRFHEIQFNDIHSTVATFAPGHAVLFKKEAIDLVKGYNENLRVIHEDFDICERLNLLGYQTFFCSKVHAISFQNDTIKLLARKHITRIFGGNYQSITYKSFFLKSSKDFLYRIGRNIYKGRITFLPLDFLIYFLGFYYFEKRKSRVIS